MAQNAGVGSKVTSRRGGSKGVRLCRQPLFGRADGKWQEAGGRKQDILPVILKNCSSVRAPLPRIFINFGDLGDSFLSSGGSFWRPEGSFSRSGRGLGDFLGSSWAQGGLREGF